MSRNFTVQPDNLKISIKGKFRFTDTLPDFTKPATPVATRPDSPTRILDDNGLYDREPADGR